MEPEALAPEPPELPEDCGHKTWTLACPRCFFEMFGIAKQTVQLSQQEAQTAGAILMNWHVLMVLSNMEKQLIPLTQSLDLQRNALSKDLILNMQQISMYLIRLVADKDKLNGALAGAAKMAATMQQHMESRMETETVVPERSLITLTDVV